MTREPYNDSDVYWKLMTPQGNVDYCSWFESKNYSAMIIGEMKLFSESLVDKNKKPTSKEILDEMKSFAFGNMNSEELRHIIKEKYHIVMTWYLEIIFETDNYHMPFVFWDILDIDLKSLILKYIKIAKKRLGYCLISFLFKFFLSFISS